MASRRTTIRRKAAPRLRGRRGGGFPGALLLLAAGLTGAPVATAEEPGCPAVLREVRPPVLLPIEGPQAVAVDGADGSLWVGSAISHEILHLSPSLEIKGSIVIPFTPRDAKAIGGISYRPERDTLLVSEPVLNEIWEVSKDGVPTGTVVPLDRLPRPVNVPGWPYVKGIAYDPDGDEGRGSVWLVETIMTALYEVTLQGEILRSFCHPDDRDGCPGLGSAAPSSEVRLVREGGLADGRVVGLELIGGTSRREWLRRVDLEGNRTGVDFFLEVVGGRPGGFARGRLAATLGGEPGEVLFVTVESSAELHILQSEEPGLRPLRELVCDAEDDETVHLGWSGYDSYERIEVLRDGELVVTLPGSETAYTDVPGRQGLLGYSVVASGRGCSTRLECSALLGPGRVLRRTGLQTAYAVGITEDGGGNLWISELGGQVIVCDKDLNLLTSFPGPFLGADDTPTGIAYSPRDDTFFVVDATTGLVAEIDQVGAPASDPFPSGVPSDPEHPALVTALLFDPEGAGGAGSFWYLDMTSGTIQERTRGGELLSSCVHPDQVATPPPAGSDLGPYMGGMSAVPGSAFGDLELTAGDIRERRLTRILRPERGSCQRRPGGVSLEDVALAAPPTFLGIHRSVHEGRPVIYAVQPRYPESWLIEIDASAPEVPRLADLRASQPGEERDVQLSFENPGGLDAIVVFRDRDRIATLPGDATAHLDRDVPAGVRTYRLEGVRGDERGGGVSSSLRVGPGSRETREFAFPNVIVHQVALDPVSGGYVTASAYNGTSDDLHLYDRDLAFAGKIPSPFPYPRQVAALAVRDAGGKSEIYCLGWSPGAPPGVQLVFPIRVVDARGTLVRELQVEPPAPRGKFLVFPSGLAWDGATDTLWLLERNSATVTNFALDGTRLGSFPHPAPLYQDQVYNYGIAVDGARGAIYLSSAGPLDHEITRIVETMRLGTLTGVEIPVGSPDYVTVRGFALDASGTRIVAACVASPVEDLVRHRLFDSVPPVADLSCSRPEGQAEGRALGSVLLSWANGGAYEALAVFRDGGERAVLPGGSSSWEDPSPGLGPGYYRVAPRRGDLEGPGAICGPVDARPFVRGDVEENGVLNISDPIAVLGYLFLGIVEPPCLKAADADDSGAIDITDAVAILTHLFLSGPALPRPYPQAGLDPTEDALRCR